ncbi:RtcB family protein [Tautonia plasticadhaerens]|uniref:tRNA-splicing ligase RtcB n=1 Tax=Tautonia plasticadhaerens TaxID=2527974 RepID=A0A518GXC1_9BACT|nr:RtcB family protein [Tautonia plasticadhaerens]QDV33237.1 RNA-splicing ligase RtcB [Tautonia plasticadhaerens]
MPGAYTGPLEKVGPCQWKIPRSYREDMRVDGLIFADDTLIEQIRRDQGPEQVANVATLPGIQRASLAMPDIHWGYGFAIGGVAATDPEQGGVISPGGVGYDINCGVRLLRSDLSWDDARPHIKRLVDQLYRDIPTGVGQSGRYSFRPDELSELMSKGSSYVVDRGWGAPRDLEFTEAGGRLDDARPDLVSPRAFARGADQCGTLGSGNHFLEVQVVDRVIDDQAAGVMGLREGMVTLLIHSGSRGLGYQVCDDHLAMFRDAPQKYGFTLPDRQLACAPVLSPEGQSYLGAMRAAANYAWCNRQLLTHQARLVFERIFGESWAALGLDLVYDVAHNIAKFEDHDVGDDLRKSLCVHRKGATRAFPPGHPEIPRKYHEIGQPVIIPGSMGTASWVLAGQAGSMAQSFGSSCHGAGRMMSRTAAIKLADGRRIDKELDAMGIIARARGHKGLAEEQPAAYKDVDQVVEVVDSVGISKKVARLRPVGVIKG